MGVPIIYASLNGVHLLPPSDQAKAAVEAKMQVRLSAFVSFYADTGQMHELSHL